MNNLILLIAVLLIFLYFNHYHQQQIEKFSDIYEPSSYQSEQVLRQIYHQLPPECQSTLNTNAINRIIPVLKSLPQINLKEDIFYHVGASCGRSTIEFWLKTGITSKGIDTEESRLDIANQALDYLNTRTDLTPKTYLGPHNAIEFLNQSVPSNDANLVYLENPRPHVFEQTLQLPNLKLLMFSGTCPPIEAQKLKQKFPKHVTITIPQNWAQDNQLNIFHK